MVLGRESSRVRHTFAAAVLAWCLLGGTGVMGREQAPVRYYDQELVVHYGTAAAAAAASLAAAPVPGGRRWAFSARWDDSQPNNLAMRTHMAKFGLKGTFYLNGEAGRPKTGADYAQSLLVEGFSIGGHTQTHPKLPERSPGLMFQEILANRIEKECHTNTPVNSFSRRL